MLDTEASGRMKQTSSDGFWRTLKLAAVMLGVGLVMASGTARAQEDEEDERTFEEKIIDNIMSGIGGTNMENRGIDYRERSPLVVPPKLDLPAPATANAQAPAPNWPKDPDDTRRKEAIAARKKSGAKPTPEEAARPLSPAELNKGRVAAPARTNNDPIQPGTNTNNPMLSPAQLGFTSSLFGMFKGNSSESTAFTSEPTRETLTQPPPGYQTPSSNYAYGTGPKESLNKQFDVMSGKDR